MSMMSDLDLEVRERVSRLLTPERVAAELESTRVAIESRTTLLLEEFLDGRYEEAQASVQRLHVLEHRRDILMGYVCDHDQAREASVLSWRDCPAGDED